VSEVALPTVEESTPAGADDALTEQNRAIDEADGENVEPAKVEEKPEKTPEQREIERLRKGIDRKTRQREQARAEAEQLRQQLAGLTPRQIARDNQDTADDSQPLSLTRAELAEYVKSEAQRLAPTLAEQRSEEQRRQGVLSSLAKTWGQEKFDEIASDLDAAFDGLKTTGGGPKPAIEAVFEADDPAKVIEYLADPEHADEAEAISRMSAAQAGRAIAKLETKIASDKPQVSKAPKPIEAVKGAAPVAKPLSDLPYEDFVKRRERFLKEHR
jgi:hypothetical protein